MCVVLVYFFTSRMSIFEKFLLDDILLILLTKHHMIKAERVQTKSGNGAIGYLLDISLARNNPTAGYYILNCHISTHNERFVMLQVA